LPSAVTANEGIDIAGEQIIFSFQLAISGRSHEGVDIAGEKIIFISLLAISGPSQLGHRHRRRAKKKSISPRRKNPYLSAKKNRYRGEEKIDIAAKKKSISPRKKNRYRRDEKLIIAWKKKLISPRRKIDYRVEEKIDIAAKEEAAVAESSYQTQEHHLRGEQKRKLCLLELLSTELSKALRDRRCGQKISF
jgi:hypothetical protein